MHVREEAWFLLASEALAVPVCLLLRVKHEGQLVSLHATRCKRSRDIAQNPTTEYAGGNPAFGRIMYLVKVLGSGGIRTHASEETGALNQRLRPLGHATVCPERRKGFIRCTTSSVGFHSSPVTKRIGGQKAHCFHSAAKRWELWKMFCQKWDSNPRPHTWTRTPSSPVFRQV